MLIVLIAAGLVIVVLAVWAARLSIRLNTERGQRRDDIEGARKDSVSRSLSVNLGKITERIAPILPDFPYLPGETRWIGGEIDCIVFAGLTDPAADVEVIFLDIKTGPSARFGTRQRRIRDAARSGRVRVESWGPEFPGREIDPADILDIQPDIRGLLP